MTAPNPGVMTGPGTNTYLVGTAALAVVDPGPDDPTHRKTLISTARERGGDICWVLVTHTHRDHAPGANALAAATGAEVIGFRPAEAFAPDRTVEEGWFLDGPDFTLRALHTPGHASDHLCWLLVAPGVLLSGDHVMHGSTVVIRPPDGDMARYLASLDRLLRLEPPLVAIAPGHGRLIDDPAGTITAIAEHRAEREERVAAALAAAGTASVDELLPAVYADVTEETRRKMARYSLWAHLAKLADEGRAEVVGALSTPPAPGLLVGPAGDPGDDVPPHRWAVTPSTVR